MARPPGEDPGLIDALRRLGSDLFGALQHRLELASIEVGEAGGRLVFTMVASIAALGLLGGSVVALSAWLAFALWPTLGRRDEQRAILLEAVARDPRDPLVRYDLASSLGGFFLPQTISGNCRHDFGAP